MRGRVLREDDRTESGLFATQVPQLSTEGLDLRIRSPPLVQAEGARYGAGGMASGAVLLQQMRLGNIATLTALLVRHGDHCGCRRRRGQGQSFVATDALIFRAEGKGKEFMLKIKVR